MGDPVTTGMIIGAGTGALTNRRNPLQGAMLGGALGAGGGSFYSGFAGSQVPIVEASGGLANATNVASPTIGQSIGAGFSNIGSTASGAMDWMNKNPVTTGIGFKLAEQAFAPEQPMQMAPAGQVSRGQVAPPMDYMSLLNPQQQTVIRPATPSLI